MKKKLFVFLTLISLLTVRLTAVEYGAVFGAGLDTSLVHPYIYESAAVQMKVNDITVINGSNNVFTIEWYWEDDDPRDVIVGMAEPTQYYTLNLAITAREYHDQ